MVLYYNRCRVYFFLWMNRHALNVTSDKRLRYALHVVNAENIWFKSDICQYHHWQNQYEVSLLSLSSHEIKTNWLGNVWCVCFEFINGKLKISSYFHLPKWLSKLKWWGQRNIESFEWRNVLKMNQAVLWTSEHSLNVLVHCTVLISTD